MQLIGEEVLTKAARKHSDAKRWLQNWIETVTDAQWSGLDDIRDDYPSAYGVKLKSGTVVTIFNVKGNEYRLLTLANFQSQIVVALEFLTHHEYDKDFWKQRY